MKTQKFFTHDSQGGSSDGADSTVNKEEVNKETVENVKVSPDESGAEPKAPPPPGNLEVRDPLPPLEGHLAPEAIKVLAAYMQTQTLPAGTPKAITRALEEFISTAPISVPAIMGFAQRLADPNDANLAVPATAASYQWLTAMLNLTLPPKEATILKEWLQMS